jgi:hypothetical protein
MDSTRYNNGSPYRYFFWSRSKVGDDGHLTIISCDGLAHYGLSYSILALWLTQILKELSTIRISIRITMSHVYLVIIVLKLDLESQGVVETSSLLLEGVLEVANVLPVSVPANSLSIVAVSHLL